MEGTPDQDREEADELLPLVYEELRALAARHLQGERADHTLAPTALVHEAYLRLQALDHIQWRGRTHFFAVAATALRRTLVDHARARGARKRGDDRGRVSLRDSQVYGCPDNLDVLALSEALEKLAQRSERQAEVVQLRFFAGLSVAEVGELLDLSEDSVKRDWRFARAWLNRELEGSE